VSTAAPVAPTATPATPVARPAGRHARWRPRRLLGRAILNIVALALFAVMVFPVYWMVATAFKPGVDIFRLRPKFFPAPATLDNFRSAFSYPYFWNDVRNSLVIVGSVVVLSIVLAFFAALALARFRFYGRRPFIILIIGVQMVPLAALIIPVYVMLSRAGQVNQLSGVVVTYLMFVLPFSVWTLRGFMLGVPRELEEAAMVDGLSRFGAFTRILLPLVAPGLVATSIFAFIQAWNEYLFAYILLSSPEKQTLTIWLASFTTVRGTQWGPLMAAATITALPVVIFFIIVHRKLAVGLTAGAVKA
jgi:N,N'-diacetylchitobiose transport system permease protein